MIQRIAGRKLSTRFYLLCLVSAVAIPLLAFVALLLTRYTVTERARYERDAAQIARQVALVVDGELGMLAALLKGLATSSALAMGDLAQFHAEATRLVDNTDYNIVVRDLGSRQLLNTQRPIGADLPPAVPLSELERSAFLSGRLLVSDVYASPVSREARVAVALPVTRDGTTHVLAITVPTSRIRDALLPAVPQGWIIGVGDRSGKYVARSTRHEDVTGTPGVASYLAKAVGRSGTFTSENFEEVKLLAGYYRSEFSEWLIGANIPLNVVEAPLWQSLTALAILGGAALALSTVLAYLFGTGFATATSGLADRAAALGKGEPVYPISSPLAEMSLVGEALAAAATAIKARTHELESVLATVPAAVWFSYDPQVRKVFPNKFAAELMRVATSPDGSLNIRNTLLDHVEIVKDNRPLLAEELPLQRAMRGERVKDEEYTFLFKDGTACTLLTNATALKNDDDVVVGAVSVSLDISERVRSEEQRKLLINELNHRVKNTLAMVQSIALQTLRGAASMAEANDALTDRLIALSKAHDVLTRESWEGAELHDIVGEAISPHGGSSRFKIAGPTVWLIPSLSLSLSLALHELATNAAKYGALSTERGTIAISWELISEAGATLLKLRWVESGGPAVREPTKRGFGSRLIASLSAEFGQSPTIRYEPEGVVFVMQAQIRTGGAHIGGDAEGQRGRFDSPKN